MVARRTTISVRLNDAIQVQIARAARLLDQTPAEFLQRAGTETARQVLLAWAAGVYRDGGRTLSELAEETGLGIEEIMESLADAGHGEALDFYLVAARTAARLLGDDTFLQAAQVAVADIRNAR